MMFSIILYLPFFFGLLSIQTERSLLPVPRLLMSGLPPELLIIS